MSNHISLVKPGDAEEIIRTIDLPAFQRFTAFYRLLYPTEPTEAECERLIHSNTRDLLDALRSEAETVIQISNDTGKPLWFCCLRMEDESCKPKDLGLPDSRLIEENTYWSIVRDLRKEEERHCGSLDRVYSKCHSLGFLPGQTTS